MNSYDVTEDDRQSFLSIHNIMSLKLFNIVAQSTREVHDFDIKTFWSLSP